MDLTIIRIHVKKILTGNFVFMSLVAIIFGILTLFSKGQEKIIGSYTYIDMLWKGYIFLYIIFACELSKDLLQMEKITRRIEWLIANGTRLQSILINHTVSLWISTLLLLMPLLGITIYKIGSPDVAQILDFFTFTLLSSIIINAVILVIRDMNKYKGISLRISGLMLMPSIFNNNLFDDDWFGFPFYGYADKAENRAEKKLYGHHANNLMKTDIKEMKDGYELEIDLPGFKKDEVTAELKDGYLTVSAAKGLDQDEQEKETGRYIRRERYAGACQRSYYVGEDITEEDIKAEFKHGILKLFVPKKEAKPAVEEKKYITIEG